MNSHDIDIEYWKTFRDKVYTMRCNGDLCDVTLRTEDGKITYAHRLVLAASSSYFQGMFCNTLKETGMKEVLLKGVNMTGLEAVIEFLYTRLLALTHANVESILYVANLLQIQEIEEECSCFLKEHIQIYNCLGILQLAHTLAMSKLYAHANSYCLKNFLKVTKEEEFLSTPIDILLSLLKHDGICVADEKCIYDAAMKWIKYDEASRVKYLLDILAAVRLSSVNLNFLNNELLENRLIRGNSYAKEMLAAAIHFSRLSPSERMKCSQLQSCKPRDTSKLAKKIIALGGCTVTDENLPRELLDFDSNAWKSISSNRQDWYGFAATPLNGSIYILGGYNKVQSLAACYSLTENEESWSETRIASMNIARSYHGAATSYGRIFAVGGLCGTKRLASVEVLSHEQNKWLQVHELPHPLQYSGVCSYDGFICTIGGHDGKNRISSVLCYDPQVNTWTDLMKLGEPRSLVGACTQDSRLFAIGGYNGDQYLRKAEALDSREGKWQTLSSLQHPRAAFGVSLLYGMIYVAGGFNGSFLSSTECYDSRKNQWLSGQDLNHSRAHFSMVAI